MRRYLNKSTAQSFLLPNLKKGMSEMKTDLEKRRRL